MKVNFYLKTPNGDYKTWIYCLIRYQNLNVKVYTDQKIHPNFWNAETQRVRSTSKFPTHPEYNDWLKSIVRAADKIEKDWKNQNSDKLTIPPLPVDELKKGLKKYLTKITKVERSENKKRSFWGYYDTFITRMKNGTRTNLSKGTPLSPRTIFQFENLKRHLQNFEQKKKYKVEFETIDLYFYKLFIDYVTIDLDTSPNTIGKLITNLKVFLREAFEDGLTTNNIFTHRKFKSIKFSSDTVYLTNEEIQEMQNLDLSKELRLERVRDMFVIGCYTGLRFSDFTQIKPKHIGNGMIEIVQSKTGNTVVIPMTEAVVKILKKYDNALPKISNQKFNKYLYEVCQKCTLLEKEVTIKGMKGGKVTSSFKPKYEFVSSHTGRRSFATNEYKAGDLEISEIMSLTGHKTEKSFYRYIRETPKETAIRIQQKFIERDIKRASMTGHLKAV
jgi:integrase